MMLLLPVQKRQLPAPGPDTSRPHNRRGARPGRAPDAQRLILNSAELQGPGTLLRIQPGIFDFAPDLSLKRSQTKPKISGTVPTDRHTTIPNDSGPISACFGVFVDEISTLCYATMLPGRKSSFRAGFQPDSKRESLKIGPPAGLRPAGGPSLRLSQHTVLYKNPSCACVQNQP